LKDAQPVSTTSDPTTIDAKRRIWEEDFETCQALQVKTADGGAMAMMASGQTANFYDDDNAVLDDDFLNDGWCLLASISFHILC
jgi:hypothetical protein